MKALVIPVRRKPFVRDVPDELEAWQALVGGYVERVSFGHDAVLYCDEEGKHKELPVNEIATRLAREEGIGLCPGDLLVGPVFLVGLETPDGASHLDVPERFVRAFIRKQRRS